MTFFIRRCLQFFLVFEVLIFVIIYCFGPKGLKALYEIRQMHAFVYTEIINLQQEIEALKYNVALYQTDFAKEKIARERLLMKRSDETVYFKNSKVS